MHMVAVLEPPVTTHAAKPFSALPGSKTPKTFFEKLNRIRALSNDAIGLLGDEFKQYGDMTGSTFAGHDQVNITNPNIIHEILVTQQSKFIKDEGYTNPKTGLARFLGNGLITSNGDYWKRQRKLAAPALHHKRIANYAETMVKFTEDLLAEWKDGDHFDMAAQLKKLTMSIVARTLFNTSIGDETKRIGVALLAVQEVAGGVPILPPWVPTPAELRARKAKVYLREIIMRMIKDRRESGEDGGDLLTMLLLSRGEDGEQMTDQQALDEALTLFLAGYETTSNMLTWCFYELARNPEIEAKLHAELDSVLAGRAPTMEDFKKLPYTERVIKEALRKYPSAWLIARENTESVRLGEYEFPAGTHFAIMIYHLHHDPRFFPDPERFDPERFNPENEAAIPKYAYIPFSDGPRICIGNMFALMEGTLCLATIASHYSLALAHPDHVAKMIPRLTINVAGGLPMIAHARK